MRFQQELDYPTVPVEIDRERAGMSGVTACQVANAVVVTASSSRYVARNFWVDPKNGTSYQVQVEVPTPQMNSPAQLETVSLAEVNPALNLMIRDVARVGQGTMPGEIDRTSSQRYVCITANIEGEDLGRASRQIEQAIAAAGEPPRGVRVLTRGQVAPMSEMFAALGVGLALAVVVILVLLTAYFESPRLALASVSSVPGVLCGAYVAPGSKARVRIPALANHEFEAKVTRTSWALNPTSRTLGAQIELPNPKGRFLPGMYAYGSVIIERPNVRTLPTSAVTQIGNQIYCYLAMDGKAVRTPVQTGVSDGAWVEVTGKLAAESSQRTWAPFDGTEAVIDGGLSEISDGDSVTVDSQSQ